MKKEYELNLPDSCQVLKNDEMLQSEGSWYCDISDKKILLSPNDLTQAKLLIPKLIGKLNPNSGKPVPLPPFTDPYDPNYPLGMGMSFKDGTTKVWKIETKKEYNLALSNKVTW